MDTSPPSTPNQTSADGQPEVGVTKTDITPLLKLIDDDTAQAVNRFREVFRNRHNPGQNDQLLQYAFAFTHFYGSGITHPTPERATDIWEALISLSELYHEIAMTDSFIDELPDLFHYAIVGIDQLIDIASTNSFALVYDFLSNARRVPTQLIEMDVESHLLPVLEKSVVDRLIAPSPAMLQKLWSYRHVFLGNDVASRRRLRSMAKLMNGYCHLCNVRKATPPLEKTQITELLFLSWFHASEEDGEDLGSKSLGSISLLAQQATEKYRNSLAENFLLTEFGAEAYVDRFLRDVNEESRVDVPLQWTISTTNYFCTKDAFAKVLCARNEHTCLARALMRQKERGRKQEEWSVEVEYRLWGHASSLIGQSLLQLSHPVSFVPDYPHGYAQLIEVAAHVVTLCASADYDLSRAASALGTSLVKILKLLAEDETQGAPVLARARESAKEHWYPAMKSLRTMDPAQQKVQKGYKGITFVWRRLGETIGLREKEERERIARELAESRKKVQTFCAWSECEYHTQKPERPLRTCAGCDEVRYCDRSCQMKDWKAGHKKKCRRVKV